MFSTPRDKQTQSVRNSISIKTLTFIGLSAAILPLIFVLLYGSNQINALASKSAESIVDVAWITDKDRALYQSLIQLQRTNSQYLILQEKDILDRFMVQKDELLQLLFDIGNELSHQLLNEKVEQLTQHLTTLSHVLTESPLPSVEQVQTNYAQINQLQQEISLLNAELIDNKVTQVQETATNTQGTLLNTLIIIPFSLVAAAIFTLIIAKPLEALSLQIGRLEQGKFDQAIHYSGAQEVLAIGHALEQMRVQLQQLEMQKSSFIRHISHELKTPLAAIREGTELLYDNSVGELNEAQQEVTNIIRSNVSRLQMLIEDLLDFNIVLDSTSLSQLQSIEITSVYQECLEQRKLDCQAKKLITTISGETCQIETNYKQLSVIFDNLLSNAIKYSPESGEITLTIKKHSDKVVMLLSDQGPGISEHNQSKVFDAFYQGPAPDNSAIKSSGLGLTIVKELVRRLQGSIELLNEPRVRGLTVKLTLPLKKD